MKKETKKSSVINLTEGTPIALMLRYATPMLIGGIVQALYSMVDSAVLGHFNGADALASIGAASSTVNLILMFAMAFTNAVSVQVSQATGSGSIQDLKNSVRSGFLLCLAGSIAVGLASVLFAGPLMRLLKTPDNVIADTVLYVRIVGGCCIAQFFYNLAASILKAMGDSRRPLLFLVVCSLLNIALDLTAVLLFHLGVGGVAAATAVSQLISAIISMLYIFVRYPELNVFRMNRSTIGRKGLKELTGMGLQMCFQNILLNVGMMVITAAVNVYGSDIVAAFTVGSNVQNLVTVALYSYVIAFSVYAGQNLGAGKIDHLKQGFRQMLVLTTGICLAATAVSWIIPRQLSLLYINADEAGVIPAAVSFIRIQAAFFVILGLIELYNACLRGLGKITVCTVSSVAELICKVGGALLLSALMGYTGIWFAAPIGWVLGLIPSAVYYHSGRWIPRGNA